MPSLAVMVASCPSCPKGQLANIPGALCGEPLRWDQGHTDAVRGRGGVWRCVAHGPQMSGREAAQRAGYAGMWFGEAAA